MRQCTNNSSRRAELPKSIRTGAGTCRCRSDASRLRVPPYAGWKRGQSKFAFESVIHPGPFAGYPRRRSVGASTISPYTRGPAGNELKDRIMTDRTRRDLIVAATATAIAVGVAATGARAAASMSASKTSFPPVVHHVFFWLKNPDSKEDLAK